MKYAAIADLADRGQFPVAFMCDCLGVSKSGYYAWRSRDESEHDKHDAVLLTLIKDAHERLRGNPGVRRIRAELASLGHRVAHKRVHRLMKAAGLQGRHPRAWRRTTVPDPHGAPVPDLLGQDFTASKPNQAWCGDITYVKTWEGWAYVATVMDLYSRAIIGWAIADHMRTDLIIDALDMAIRRRRRPRGVIFHSDRGSQYTSDTFAAFCEKHTVRRSMGRTGVCYDNAAAESFFATYKKELIHTQPWTNVTTLRKETLLWIEGYYNRQRRHSTLGYLTPDEYESGKRTLLGIAA